MTLPVSGIDPLAPRLIEAQRLLRESEAQRAELDRQNAEFRVLFRRWELARDHDSGLPIDHSPEEDSTGSEGRVLGPAAQERRRIGEELHDGIAQELTGLGFFAERLSRDLAAKGLAEAEVANDLVSGLQAAVGRVRALISGLVSAEVDPSWLSPWIAGIASHVERQFGISFRFQCEHPLAVQDDRTATHLWYIAKEAVSNALKHSGAGTLEIRLGSSRGRFILEIRDDGQGIGRDATRPGSLGLQIMRDRGSHGRDPGG